MLYRKFWTFILKIKLRRDCPVFYNLGDFSAFSGLGAISSELLKVNRIEFQKSEKNPSQGIVQWCYIEIFSQELVLHLVKNINKVEIRSLSPPQTTPPPIPRNTLPPQKICLMWCNGNKNGKKLILTPHNALWRIIKTSVFWNLIALDKFCKKHT